jgi:two-component system, chemotaxis family, protein-glutamate methylesterase/glutaminase
VTVRVLVVDDSGIHRRALASYIEASPALELCGSAVDGAEAVAKVGYLQPDIVLMDVQMPKLDGLAATREIMSERPTPILLMTAAENLAREVDLGLRALSLGALELIPKPDLDSLSPADQTLARRLELMAGVPVIHHPRGGGSGSGSGGRGLRVARSKTRPSSGYFRRASWVVGLVSSTGGPRALTQILQALPSDFPAAIVIVQHIAASFEEGLARWLSESSPLNVSVGRDEAPLLTGQVYLAPQGFHAELTEDRRLRLVQPHEVLPGRHYPSGDHLLASLAVTYGRQAIGVVLTGIGSDGAEGLLNLRRAGGRTLAQDEASSVVFGMPSVAAERGAAEQVLALSDIAAAIEEFVP